MLQLGALAALTAGYIDAKHGINEDIKTIGTVLRLMAKVAIQEKLGVSNILYLLEKHLYRRPNDTALEYVRQVNPNATNLDNQFKVEKWTWEEMFNQVYKYAHVLYYDYGIESKDCVAMDCTNNPDFIFLWLALWSIGAVPVFINYNLTDKSLLHCIKISQSKYIFTDMEVADNVLALKDDIAALDKQIVLLDGNFRHQVSKAYKLIVPQPERNKDKSPWSPAMYIYTSGTTGLPKSAIFSWTKAVIGGGSYGAAMRIGKQDVVYSPMPLYHSTAAALGFLSTMINGGTYAIGHKFSARTYWTQAKLCNATYVQYVGEVCRYLLNSPPGPDDQNHNVKVAIGNGMRADVWQKFKDRFNVSTIGEFYGATELPTALTNFQQGDVGVGAVANYGTILKHFLFNTRYCLAAVDPEDANSLWRDPNTGFGRKTGTNEPGELLLKVPNPQAIERVFQGYSNDKKSGDSKIVRDFFKKGDAWIRSGDLLKLDDNSMVYFTDRLGDTFRWKSENVSTNEVEEAFSGVQGVNQVVVVGVSVPNHEGRAGFAVIEPTNLNGKLPDTKLIAQKLKKELPKYAVPVFVKFTKEKLESTGTMKVQKARYRNQKIPSDEETVYVFKGDDYKPITQNEWNDIVNGKSRL